MKYFTLSECTASSTAKRLGIDNTPSAEHKAHIIETIGNCLDPMREDWEKYCVNNNLGKPAIQVSSGYRSPKLNTAVKGAKTSAHSVGYAFDLVPLNGKMAEFKKFCREYFSDHDFDQLISENEDKNGKPQWIHVGYKNVEGKQRKEFLSMINGRYYSMTK